MVHARLTTSARCAAFLSSNLASFVGQMALNPNCPSRILCPVLGEQCGLSFDIVDVGSMF